MIARRFRNIKCPHCNGSGVVGKLQVWSEIDWIDWIPDGSNRITTPVPVIAEIRDCPCPTCDGRKKI